MGISMPKRRRSSTPFRPRKRRRLTYSQKKIVKRLISNRQEKKFFQKTFDAGVDVGGTMTLLTDVPQGDTDTSRDGDELRINNVDMRMVITGADTTNFVRVILFQWYDDSTPTAAKIIEGWSAGSILNSVRPPLHDGRKTFHVLHDRTYTVNDNTSGGSPYQRFVRRKLYKLGRRKIQFEGGTTAGYNHIYMFAFSDSGAAANPSVSMIHRLNFTDS